MLTVLFKKLFLGLDGMSSAGVVLQLDEPTLLFAKLGDILADEAALKLAFDAKGASGLRPCQLCKNVRMKGSDLANRDATHYFIKITCPDVTRFDLLTVTDMFQAMDLLLASRDTKTKKEFDQLQMSLGHNWNPHGLLADQALRRHVLPISTLTYDPMHLSLIHI